MDSVLWCLFGLILSNQICPLLAIMVVFVIFFHNKNRYHRALSGVPAILCYYIMLLCYAMRNLSFYFDKNLCCM